MKAFDCRMTWLFGFCFLGFAQSANVMANPSGISGYSGSNIVICRPCHANSLAPVTVSLVANSGSNTVVAGSTSSYTLSLSGGSTRAGLDVAVTGGDLMVTSIGTRMLNYEVVHSSPRSLTNGAGSWTFNWQAPDQDGTYTIYAAVLSSDGTDYSTGTATINLTVVPGSGNPQTPSGGETTGGGSNGGGGCSIKPGAIFDPVIPLMIFIACFYVFLNRKNNIPK